MTHRTLRASGGHAFYDVLDKVLRKVGPLRSASVEAVSTRVQAS